MIPLVVIFITSTSSFVVCSVILSSARLGISVTDIPGRSSSMQLSGQSTFDIVSVSQARNHPFPAEASLCESGMDGSGGPVQNERLLCPFCLPATFHDVRGSSEACEAGLFARAQSSGTTTAAPFLVHVVYVLPNTPNTPHTLFILLLANCTHSYLSPDMGEERKS